METGFSIHSAAWISEETDVLGIVGSIRNSWECDPKHMLCCQPAFEQPGTFGETFQILLRRFRDRKEFIIALL